VIAKDRYKAGVCRELCSFSLSSRGKCEKAHKDKKRRKISMFYSLDAYSTSGSHKL